MKLIKRIFHKGEMAWTKIICLAFGMALGLLLLAEVLYEHQYNGFVPNAQDTYVLKPKLDFIKQTKESSTWDVITGGLTPEFAKTCPMVEAYTRYTFTWVEPLWRTEDKRPLRAEALLVDEHFFEVFPRPLIIGEKAGDILANDDAILISRSLYEKLGKSIIGHQIQSKIYDKLSGVVMGVYEDFPSNSHLSHTDLIFPMRAIKKAFSVPDNWFEAVTGGDNFVGYVRLKPGSDPKVAETYFKTIFDKWGITEENKQAGVEYSISLQSIAQLNMESGFQRTRYYGLLIVGIFVWAVALLNYLLLTFSSVLNRAKTLATYRCYGASGGALARMIVPEVLCSAGIIPLAIALLMLVGADSLIYRVFGHGISVYLTSTVLLPLILLEIVVIALSCLLTLVICIRIPVAYAYRRYTDTRKWWKLALLFVQVAMVSLIAVVMPVLALQYHRITNFNLGFDRDKVVYFYNSTTSVTDDKRLEQELARLPNVESLAWSNSDITRQLMRTYISDNDNHEVFGVAVVKGVTPEFARTLGIELLNGNDFSSAVTDSVMGNLLLSQSMAIEYNRARNNHDSPVGNILNIGRSNYRIAGIYKDIQIGSRLVEAQQNNMMVILAAQKAKGVGYVRLRSLTSQTLDEVRRVVQRVYNDPTLELKSLSGEFDAQYESIYQMRNLLGMSCICVLIIMIVGLIAYITDEVNRFRLQIAIRVIHGAPLMSIPRYFLIDLLRIVVPALLLGAVCGYVASRRILQIFVDKISLSWYLVVVPTLLLVVLIAIVATLLVMDAARRNPIENIRTE